MWPFAYPLLPPKVLLLPYCYPHWKSLAHMILRLLSFCYAFTKLVHIARSTPPSLAACVRSAGQTHLHRVPSNSHHRQLLEAGPVEFKQRWPGSLLISVPLYCSIYCIHQYCRPLLPIPLPLLHPSVLQALPHLQIIS